MESGGIQDLVNQFEIAIGSKEDLANLKQHAIDCEVFISELHDLLFQKC